MSIFYDLIASPFSLMFLILLSYTIITHFSKPHYIYKQPDGGVWTPVSEAKYYPEAKYQQDLISFGNYLLSEERKKLYEENPAFPDSLLLEERKGQVSHADVENWKSSK